MKKKNILEQLEKRMIFANRFLIKKGVPRIPEKSNDFHFKFEGSSVLEDFASAGDDILRDFSSGTSVLIKINLNSANEYPASTSLDMLEALLHLLAERGITKICVGDSSGVLDLPTRKVMKEKSLFSFRKKYGIQIKIFDYGFWVNVPVKGEYFKNILIASAVYDYEKIIHLANLKSHKWAGFTCSTKLMVGFMHPRQRLELHKDHIREKIAEISLALKPDLSIIDARKVFVDGGPDFGKKVNADTIIVDSDLFSADLAAYKILYSFKEKNNIRDLSADPLKNDFFKHYMKIHSMKK